MPPSLVRIGRDLRNRRYIDAYVVSGMSIVFAALTVVGDVVPVDVRWAVALTGLGLLVFRITVPGPGAAADTFLGDRVRLPELDLDRRLREARTVHLYAPSGVNFLTSDRCHLLREGPLARRDGSVRVVVMDPSGAAALDFAAHQLDSADHNVQQLADSLAFTLGRLSSMASWTDLRGDFAHGTISFNPGFSLLIIDRDTPRCTVLVETHGYRAVHTTNRMHILLTHATAPRWTAHWTDQFDQIWATAQTP